MNATGRMRLIRSALATMLLVAAAAGCSLLPPSSPGPNRQAALDALLADYLAALERGDGTAIEAMVSPAVDANADITQVLEQFGGVRLHDVQAMWTDEFGGSYVVAMVTGTGEDGAAYEIRVPMGWADDRYDLALGQAPASGTEARPESPVP